jgi:hypothetical protein
MLAYLLALMVAVGSLVFYLAAFFLPEIHRRQDFIWSGVGLFYGLVLWSCAGRITGAVLLGQMASVALLGGLAWQTLALRREITPVAVRTVTTWQDAQQWLDASWNKLRGYFQGQSLPNALGAIGQDIQQASGTLRQRIAGPRGQTPSVDPARDRTPLRETGHNPPPSVTSPVTSTSSQPAAAPLALPWSDRLKGLLAKTTPLMTWGSQQLSGFRKSKPKRAVIDIPPRAPSIPRAQSVVPTSADLAQPWSPAADPKGESVAGDRIEADAIDRDVSAVNPLQSITDGDVGDGASYSATVAAEPEAPGETANLTDFPPDEVTNWDD